MTNEMIIKTTKKTGVLLVNLGTPDSSSSSDVYRYLIEFLTDRRVIDSPWLARQLLVRGLIVPRRYRESARIYKKIWTPEGSPLKIYGKQVEKALQKELGDEFLVALAMRYRTPSIVDALQSLINADVDRLLIFPLFPQYASATTGSVHQHVMEIISKWEFIPEVHFINNFATHPSLIDAFCSVASPFPKEQYDHVLFSFHGLPQKFLRKGDRSKKHCLQSDGCCKRLTSINKNCYSAQCHATANAIADQLNIKASDFSISFQSRLGKEPWIEPYTLDTINKLAISGKKRLLVFCPSFVCDCLETTYEIGIEYGEIFKHHGGECLDLVPGLNDDPSWIKALKQIILSSDLMQS